MSAKSSKPENVIRHEHLWASPAHEEAEAGRLDVCELADGEVVIWDVDPDHLMRAGNVESGTRWTWDQALGVAKEVLEDRASLLPGRWVRIMCDYCADPLWQKGGGMAEVADLPVPPEIGGRLRRWAEVFEDNDGWSEFLSGKPIDLAAFEAFGAEGLSIAQAVKAALPDWTVVYHDEWKHHQDPDAAREVWEYEVEAA